MNQLDSARLLARRYRAALIKANPTAAAALDDIARRIGDTWIVDPTTGPTACTVTEAAALLGVTAGRVRQLITSGEIPSAGKDTGGHLLLVDDVLDYRAARRVVAERRTSGLSSPASG